MSDLCVLKQLTRAREASEKVLQERRRNAIVLILRHLCDAGYMEAYERLSTESNISLSKVDVADNVDLLRVIQEFEDAHEAKFGRKPKLVRRCGAAEGEQASSSSSSTALRQVSKRLVGGRDAVSGNAEPSTSAPEGPPVTGQLAARHRREKGAAAEAERKAEAAGERRRDSRSHSDTGNPASASAASAAATAAAASRPGSKEHDLKVNGQQVKQQALPAKPSVESDCDDLEEHFAQRLMKPLPTSLQGELRELGQAISRDIYLESPNVRWEDIAGLDEAKRLLKEAVVMPIRYPSLFTGLLAPWKGLLLFGPPGTGKTLLAKAVATECRTTFFNISASSIISKWRGDSEKLIRVLFELARYHAPSTIFLDELDALAGARGGEGEHEASRRMKTELLIQMDGLAKGGELVFVLGATNLPWELDAAMLRRLEKRILVPLPSTDARRAMLGTLLADRCHPDCSLDGLAAATDGYSGSDVMLLAKEAAMRPLRRLMARLDLDAPMVARQQGGGRPAQQQEASEVPQLDPITQQDLDAARVATKSTAHLHQAAYHKFNEEFGAGAQQAAM